MSSIEFTVDSLNAYELYLLEFNVSKKAQELVEQMKQKLEDNNKIILEKLNHVDIMAEQYINQNKIDKQPVKVNSSGSSKFYKYIEKLKKWSA